VHHLYGGTDVDYVMNLMHGTCEILVATPGRLTQMMDEKRVSLKKLRYLVIDEADHDVMGHQMGKLAKHSSVPNKVYVIKLFFNQFNGITVVMYICQPFFNFRFILM